MSVDNDRKIPPPAPRKRRRRRRNRRGAHNDCDESVTSSESSISDRHHESLLEITEAEKLQYVAIDCEMVGLGYYGQYSSLARVCAIDWDGNQLLDLYVRQAYEVTDYRTFVSGITEHDLTSSKAVELHDCRAQVEQLIRGKVLIGHALKNDLHSLGISHPWDQTRDTGKYEPFMKERFNDGVLWPRKLKDLAKGRLRRNIQQLGMPHCPFEDAQTALDLYKHARYRWEKSMQYKINKTKEIEEKQSGQ